MGFSAQGWDFHYTIEKPNTISRNERGFTREAASASVPLCSGSEGLGEDGEILRTEGPAS